MTIRQIAMAQRTQEYNEQKASATKDGHRHLLGLEGMCVNCYGSHKNDDVDLPASVIQQVKDTALTSAKDNYGWNDTPYLSNFVKSYVPTVAVDERLATSWALQRVWREEVDRIGQYIHSKDPNWITWGQKFDLSILDDYKQGIDVKA